MVTGGAGFIGLHLVRKLINLDYEVFIVDNFYRGSLDRDFELILRDQRAKYINVNLNEVDLSEILLESNIDYIVHLAAIVGVKNVESNPLLVLDNNLSMLNGIIEFAKRQRNLKRLIFASTSEVYAGTLKFFGLEFPTKENTPLAISSEFDKRTTYALSKIYGEYLCAFSNLPYTILRPHNVYGPRMGLDHLIPEQLRRIWSARDGQSLSVTSPKHQRTFIYIDDAVETILRVMEQEKCEGKTLNLGCQKPEFTVLEVVQMCARIVGRNLQIVEGEDMLGSPLRRVPSVELLESLIEFKPKISLEQGISLTYDWYRQGFSHKS